MEPTFIEQMLALVDLSALVEWVPVIGGSIITFAVGFAVIKLAKRGISKV